MTEDASRGGPNTKGCLLALGIGFVTVATTSIGFSLTTGPDLNLSEEWSIFLFQMLLVAGPFGLLALSGVNEKLPWVIGLILTLAFWGFYVGVVLATRGDGSGANIGLGILMLASPLIIAASSTVSVAFVRRKR